MDSAAFDFSHDVDDEAGQNVLDLETIVISPSDHVVDERPANKGGKRKLAVRDKPNTRGRKESPAWAHFEKAGPHGPSNVSSGDKGSRSVWRPKQLHCTSTAKSSYQETCNFPGTTDDMSSDLGKLKLVEISPEAVTPETDQVYCISVSDSAPASVSEKCFPSISDQFDFRAKDLNVEKIQKGKLLDAEVECGSSFVLSALDNTDMVNEQSPHKREVDLSVSGSELEKGFPAMSSQPDFIAKDDNVEKAQKWKIPDVEVESGSYLPVPSAIDKNIVNGQTPRKKTVDNASSNISGSVSVGVPYDICPVKAGNVVALNVPLHVQNKTKRNEAKRSAEEKSINVLRPGMILLKSYISLKDQVEIVNKCRDLGLTSGGFYDPSYREGGKLHLKMMCLGKNWDPETSLYGAERPSDGAKPPMIPPVFCHLVKEAIQVSHSFLREHQRVRVAELVLPWASPNICIVNFYSKTGRLGLHQDKDESRESLARGLPVVSFSIGDSADFLYNDNRDIETAKKIVLESGDVLIFGGKSRHIFHGVTSILPGTAPLPLLYETHLLHPGRLNLTFREY